MHVHHSAFFSFVFLPHCPHTCPLPCLNLVSIAMIKHSNQKQLGKKNSLIHLTTLRSWSIIERSQSSTMGPGTGAEAMKKSFRGLLSLQS